MKRSDELEGAIVRNTGAPYSVSTTKWKSTLEISLPEISPLNTALCSSRGLWNDRIKISLKYFWNRNYLYSWQDPRSINFLQIKIHEPSRKMHHLYNQSIINVTFYSLMVMENNILLKLKNTIHLPVKEKATLAKAKCVHFENCHAALKLWFCKRLRKQFSIYV